MTAETLKLLNTYVSTVRAQERPQDHPSLTGEDLYKRALHARKALVKKINELEKIALEASFKEYPDGPH